MTKDNDKKNYRKGIQSIEIGFVIIKVLLQSPSPLSLKILADKSGMLPSKIHSYLVSFIKIGLVEQSTETGFYSLGHYALQLGLTYINQFNILSAAQPIMNELTQDLGYTTFLGIWGNKGPSIVYRVDGFNSQAFLDLRIGCVLPILTSALGLNFAAHLPTSMIYPLIKEELKKKSIEKKYKNLEKCYALLDKIKQRGYSTAHETLITDFSAISMPIIDYSKNMIAGLTLMGQTIELKHKESKIASILKTQTLKISTLLGGDFVFKKS